MNTALSRPIPTPIVYPDRDGKPMSDNTKQARWIVFFFDNLTAQFGDQPDVFVAADLLWYAVEGEPEIRNAPDVLVVFGRPKGDRGSYKQWTENNVPVTVVFEILSPGNTVWEMDEKRSFYEEYGAEEYYLYDPDTNRLRVFLRRGEVLRRIHFSGSFASPRLGIRFDLSGPELVVFGSDGKRFLTFEELKAQRDKALARADQAEQRADQTQQQLARLRLLSRKARRGEASEDELRELERLESEQI